MFFRKGETAITALLIRYGIWGIVFAGVAEAILLPLPMETVSIPVYLANPDLAFLYSGILVICSVIGSVIGYKVADLFGCLFLKKVEDLKAVQKVRGWYDRNVIVTLLTSAVTPIPYEIYVVSAGLCEVDGKRFVIGCLLSRMLRHLPQGILITFGGNEILQFVKEHLVIVVIIIVVGVFLYRLIAKRIEKYCR
ncbi:lipoprotein B [Lachnospiraceae bacterium KM106-2]|nr:lipoprotein B [Lachnospiraceae bacterium KM106-2]